MSKNLIKGIVLAVSMLSAGMTANALKPTQKLSASLPPLTLETIIPSQFGEWKMLPSSTGAVVANPQAETLLNQLYAQILNRTYVNSKGQAIMLSIAYGEDQRDSMQAHHPEICYPAQGFQLISNSTAKITTQFGDMPVRRLETSLNEQRHEPVTYWITVGDQATLGGISKKLIEIKYALHNHIPDGLLFRISSIDRDTSNAFMIQEQFARELLTHLTPDQRLRLAGLHN
jgi:EpsI family protein